MTGVQPVEAATTSPSTTTATPIASPTDAITRHNQ